MRKSVEEFESSDDTDINGDKPPGANKLDVHSKDLHKKSNHRVVTEIVEKRE